MGSFFTLNDPEITIQVFDSMTRTRSIILIIAASILASCQQSKPTWIKSYAYEPDEIHPIEIGSNRFPFVAISLNDKTYKLLWDTGNMSRLAVTQDIAKSLDLEVVAKTRSYDSEGNFTGQSSVYRLDRVKLFGQSWGPVDAVELEHPNLSGLVGPYFVQNKRFTLDYRNKLIAVSNKNLPEAAPGERIPLVKSPVHKLLVLIYTQINGHRVLTEIDTGKSRTVIDPTLADSLDLPQTDSGYAINSLKIGVNTFTVPSAKSKSFQGISEGLPELIRLGVGSDILSQLLLTVDYNEGLVIVKNN